MRRSAAAVSAGFGHGLSGGVLSARERVLVALAVVVLIPSVAFGRHVFALPSLIERGIALLVPGADAHGAKRSTPLAVAGRGVSLARLTDPLLTGVRPAPAPRVQLAPRRHTAAPHRPVRRGGANLPALPGAPASTVTPQPTAVPTSHSAPPAPTAPALGPPTAGAGAAGASTAGVGGATGGGGGTSGGGPVTTPLPTASVGVHDGSIGVSAGTGGGPAPVTAAAGASSAGVSAGTSAGGASAGVTAPLPTTTDPAQVATPTATAAPVTTPVLTTPAVTAPTVTVSLPPVLP